MLPDADAGGGDEEVVFAGRCQVIAKTFAGVAGDAEIDRFAPGEAHEGNEGVGVGAGDLPPAQDLLRLVDIDDLVATAHDRDSWAAMHQRVRHRQGGEDAQFRRAQERAGLKHDGAPAHILADVAEVGAGVSILVNGDNFPALVGVFLPHHPIGALRQRRPGKNAGAFSRSDDARREVPGRNLLDNAKANRGRVGGTADVGGARRVTIHGGVGPGGDIEGAGDVLGQHAAQRVVEWYTKGGLLADILEDAERGFARAQRSRHPSSSRPSSHASVASR